jgi:hypothetical protein
LHKKEDKGGHFLRFLSSCKKFFRTGTQGLRTGQTRAEFNLFLVLDLYPQTENLLKSQNF